MKKLLLAAAVLLAFAALPSPGTELGQLHPVSVLLVDREERQVTVRTDTGQLGTGETLTAALRELRETTPGHIFLDTAAYLVLQGQAKSLLPELQQLLRPGVRVCTADDPADAEQLADFLKTHSPDARLSDITPETPLQNIHSMEGRLILEK